MNSVLSEQGKSHGTVPLRQKHPLYHHEPPGGAFLYCFNFILPQFYCFIYGTVRDTPMDAKMGRSSIRAGGDGE